MVRDTLPLGVSLPKPSFLSIVRTPLGCAAKVLSRTLPALLLTVTTAIAQAPPAALPDVPYSAPDSGPLVPESLPTPLPVADLSGRTVVLSVDDGYHSIFTNVYPLLRRHRMTMTLGLIVDYVGQGPAAYRPTSRFMNEAEVRELIDSLGIEIASHSLSHPHLSRLDSSAAWREVLDSRTRLESLFGVRVETFVYPYGDMSPRVQRLTRRAGYRMARAVRPGRVDLWSDPYRIPEYELRIDTRLADVQRHIAGRHTSVVLLHQIVPVPTAFTQWSLGQFTELIEWLDSCRVRVTTLSQLYREMWHRRVVERLNRLAEAYRDPTKQLLFEDVDIDATKAPDTR